MESYSVEAILSAVDKNFSSTMKSADSSMNSLDSSTRKTNTSILDVAKGIGVFKLVDSAIGVVKNSVDGAIDRFDTLNKYPVVMQALGYSADQVDNSMSKLNKGIDGLPTSLNEIVSNTQQLAISTGDLDKGTDTAIALNNAFLASGASTADASRGMQQYVQMLSKGTVDMQSWRSIQETMPIAMDKVAKSFKDQGVNSVNELYDALQGGTVTFEDFNNRLIKLNEGVGGFAELAKKNSAGIRTSFSNIKTAVVKGLANIMTAIDEGMQGAGLGTIAENFDKIKDAVNTAFKVIAENIPPAIDFLTQLWESLKKGLDGFDVTGFAKIFEIIANVAKVAFGAILAVLPTVVEWVGKLATFFSKVVTAIQPFLPALLPIIGAWASFMVHLKGVSTAIRLFNSLKTVVTGVTTTFKILTAVMAANPFVIIVGAIVGLVAAFIYFWNTSEEFRNFWIGLWDGISEWFKQTWSGISEWFKKAWDGVSEWFSNLWQGITDATSKAWDTIKEAPSKAADWIMGKWEETKQFFADVWSNIKKGASDIWDGILNTASDAWDGVVKIVSPYIETITGLFDPLITFFSNLWSQIGTIAGAAWEVIKTIVMGPILLLIDLVLGNFDQLKTDAAMLWTTLSENIQIIISTFIGIVVGYYTALKDTVINIWTTISTTVSDLWNSFTTWISETTKAIVDGIKQAWEDFKQSVIDLFNATVQGAKDTWQAFKDWFKNLIDTTIQNAKQTWENFKQTTIDIFTSLVEGAKQTWENLKQGTIDIFNGLVDGAKRAWDNLVKSVQGLIDDVKGWFDKLREINLWEAGKAIMDSFLKGLKKAWKAVKDFVGGIGDWIRENKGPIQYDRKLLIPAGNAIMEGLNKGLTSGFDEVQSTVESMASIITDTFDNSPEIDLASNLQKANSSISTQVEHNVNMGGSTKPAIFNVNLGKQTFRAFVDDISQEMGEGTDINLEF